MRAKFALFCILVLLTPYSFFAQSREKPDYVRDGLSIIERRYNEVNERDRWEVEASYPELRLDDKPAIAFNSRAKDLVMMQIAEFKKQISEFTDEDRNSLPEGLSYYLEIGYNPEYLSRELISVGFGRSQYTGGAHPNHWSFPLNFDLRNSRAIELSDLFAGGAGFLSIISRTSIEQIAAAQDELRDDNWIVSGAGEKLENFSSWNITKKGLKFSFDPYQVGPYAAGSFETLVSFQKFAIELRSPVFLRIPEASVIAEGASNWCRNGLFPLENVRFRLAAARGKAGAKQRIYFHKDDADCPSGKDCRTKAYVIPGDKVIVAQRRGAFLCAWYEPRKGSETVGWILADELIVASDEQAPAFNKWLGNWESNGNSLEISRGIETGSLAITGYAFWMGIGDNIHIGEVDDTGTPHGDLLSFGGQDEYDCRVKMQLVGDFLVVSDNMRCGGANVTFNGVYHKKQVS